MQVTPHSYLLHPAQRDSHHLRLVLQLLDNPRSPGITVTGGGRRKELVEPPREQLTTHNIKGPTEVLITNRNYISPARQ
ncbi:hypothetical protein J6590_101616, partial [Homalodisca vitripennis]